MSNFRITEWNGAQLAKRARQASVHAIDETTQAAASQAAGMRSGSVANITSESATGNPPTGRWGVFPEPHGDPFYELFHEVGSPTVAGDNAKRRAADSEYGRLADRIRGRL